MEAQHRNEDSQDHEDQAGRRAAEREYCICGDCERWMRGCSFFFSSRRRHTRLQGDWSSDVCSSDLAVTASRCASWSTQTNWPVVATTCSMALLPAASTWAHANRPVMPLPTRAGVLGMARTMRPVPSHWAMEDRKSVV